MEYVDPILWLFLLGALLAFGFAIPRWTTRWWLLERQYRTDGDVQSISVHSFRWVSARFGLAGVTLSVEIHGRGLWMQMPFPASIISKPVFVPWHRMRIDALRPVAGIRRTEVTVEGYPRPIRFFGDPSEALLTRKLEVEPSKTLQATRDDTRA